MNSYDFFGGVGCLTIKKSFDFGGDQDRDSDTGFLAEFLEFFAIRSWRWFAVSNASNFI